MKAKRVKSAGPALQIERWIDALAEAAQPPQDDGWSSDELAEAWGVARETALKRLRQLQRAGCVTVGRRSGVSLDGRPYKMPVYQLKKGSK